MPSRALPTASTTLSRAALVRGLAWSAPAVAVVAAAPLAAASPAGFTVSSTLPGGFTRSSTGISMTGAQTVTITFASPVTDVRFTIAGIDLVDNNGANGVREAVTLSPAPGVTSLSNVSGTGAAGSPFLAQAEGVQGAAAVTYAGPITTLTITLASLRGKAVPSIEVSGISSTAPVPR